MIKPHHYRAIFAATAGTAIVIVLGLIVADLALTRPLTRVQHGLWPLAPYVVGGSIPAWIILASAAAGVLAACFRRSDDIPGRGLAGVLAVCCGAVGLLSAGSYWLEAELALPGMIREFSLAYSPTETRMIFGWPAYVAAALHLALGASGVAGIVGVLLLRRRRRA